MFDETLKLPHDRSRCGIRVLSLCALRGGGILTGCEDKFARVFSDAGVELLKLEHGCAVNSVALLGGLLEF